MENRVNVEIISADIPGALRLLVAKRIYLFDVKRIDDLKIICSMSESNYFLARQQLELRGDNVHLLKKNGIIFCIISLLKRPILLCGFLVILLLTAYLPTRILFIDIAGNENLSTDLILEELEQCGVHFGASRKLLRSEQLKNQMISSLPQLQWVGINTKGCVARVSVQEKRTEPSSHKDSPRVCSIAAVRDGLITECVVRRGALLCNVGQAVKAGQILVSGYTDCNQLILATEADAEILAETQRDLSLITPSVYLKRTGDKDNKTRISLLIGKKLINFCKDSGISDSTCVKMYSRKYMTLPGGRELPLAIVLERCISFEKTPTLLHQSKAENLMTTTANVYLRQQMISGEILHSDTSCVAKADVYALFGSYACSEMIGKVVQEESIYQYGEDN